MIIFVDVVKRAPRKEECTFVADSLFGHMQIDRQTGRRLGSCWGLLYWELFGEFRIKRLRG